jgi:hypothetical protein
LSKNYIFILERRLSNRSGQPSFFRQRWRGTPSIHCQQILLFQREDWATKAGSQAFSDSAGEEHQVSIVNKYYYYYYFREKIGQQKRAAKLFQKKLERNANITCQQILFLFQGEDWDTEASSQAFSGSSGEEHQVSIVNKYYYYYFREKIEQQSRGAAKLIQTALERNTKYQLSTNIIIIIISERRLSNRSGQPSFFRQRWRGTPSIHCQQILLLLFKREDWATEAGSQAFSDSAGEEHQLSIVNKYFLIQREDWATKAGSQAFSNRAREEQNGGREGEGGDRYGQKRGELHMEIREYGAMEIDIAMK